MDLREEIQKIEPVFKNDDGYDYRIVDEFTDSTTDEIINKILDAVLEKADSLGWVSVEDIQALREGD